MELLITDGPGRRFCGPVWRILSHPASAAGHLYSGAPARAGRIGWRLPASDHYRSGDAAAVGRDPLLREVDALSHKRTQRTQKWYTLKTSKYPRGNDDASPASARGG